MAPSGQYPQDRDPHRYPTAVDSRGGRCGPTARRIDGEMPLAAPANWSWVRDLRESRNVDRTESWRGRLPRACVGLKTSNSAVLESGEAAALRYDVMRICMGPKRVEQLDCICQNCAERTSAFGAAAGLLVSASQGTCGVGHPRLDEVLIEDLGVGGGASQPAMPESGFGFLTCIHRFYLLLCPCS